MKKKHIQKQITYELSAGNINNVITVLLILNYYENEQTKKCQQSRKQQKAIFVLCLYGITFFTKEKTLLNAHSAQQNEQLQLSGKGNF